MYRVKAQHGLVLFQTGIKEEKKPESVTCYVLSSVLWFTTTLQLALFCSAARCYSKLQLSLNVL